MVNILKKTIKKNYRKKMNIKRKKGGTPSLEEVQKAQKESNERQEIDEKEQKH